MSRSYTIRSTPSLRTLRPLPRKRDSLKWWQRPSAFGPLSKGSYIASMYSLIESLLQIALSVFDIYCLIQAAPGSRHFTGLGLVSFMFVYSGNEHVRLGLMFTAVGLIICSICLFWFGLVLIKNLNQVDNDESNLKLRPWIWAMIVFSSVRLVLLVFQSLVNDLYYLYHQVMLMLWIILIGLNVFACLVVYWFDCAFHPIREVYHLQELSRSIQHSQLSIPSFMSEVPPLHTVVPFRNPRQYCSQMSLQQCHQQINDHLLSRQSLATRFWSSQNSIALSDRIDANREQQCKLCNDEFTNN